MSLWDALVFTRDLSLETLKDGTPSPFSVVSSSLAGKSIRPASFRIFTDYRSADRFPQPYVDYDPAYFEGSSMDDD